jgi:hypothetical protein
MNTLRAIVLFGILSSTPLAVQAGTAAPACAESVHLRQPQAAGARLASVQERVDEYLEFHARATEANGRLPLAAWPGARSKTD